MLNIPQWLTGKSSINRMVYDVYVYVDLRTICVHVKLMIPSQLGLPQTKLVQIMLNQCCWCWKIVSLVTFQGSSLISSLWLLKKHARWCGRACGHCNAAWRISRGCPWAGWLATVIGDLSEILQDICNWIGDDTTYTTINKYRVKQQLWHHGFLVGLLFRYNGVKW